MKDVFLCAGIIVKNEELMIRYSLGSIYEHVDRIIVVDGGSADKTIEYIKGLDKDKKITILTNVQKGDLFDYAKQRNVYLDYIKKNIFPKYRTNLYYLRIDSDEVYDDKWISGLRKNIEDNNDKEGFRGTFYSFTADYDHLDTKHPTESRVSVFRYTPDIIYANSIHEMPIHSTTGIPLYSDPVNDKQLGIVFLPGTSYLHYAWSDVERCFQKAKVYTTHYVKQGTETLERLNSLAPNKDSWWWDKKSDILYKGTLPSVFKKYGLLPGQHDNSQLEQDKIKISAFTIIKNGLRFDYPFFEAIKSLLPIVDEYIINVGLPDEDGTLGFLHKAFDGIEKVKIDTNQWETREYGTAFLRNQTNRAKNKCKNEWVIYQQADEVYHQDEIDQIPKLIEEYNDRKDIVGFLFGWRHFDGSPDKYNGDGYPKEVRLFRKDKLESFGDAQSFLLKDLNQPIMTCQDLLVDVSDKVFVFHYSYLRDPKKLYEKVCNFDSFYHTDEELNEMRAREKDRHKDGFYNFGDRKNHSTFIGTHPNIMYPRLTRYIKNNPEWCKEEVRF